MEDLTQYLVSLGVQIAKTHKQTGESMSALVVKTASAEKLDTNATNELIGWANKGYINTFGSNQFNQAIPEEVVSLTYSDPSNLVSPVGYSYPEYSQPKGSLTKAAAVGTTQTKTDFSFNIREAVRMDIKALKTKFANLTHTMEDAYGRIQNNIGILKALGVEHTEIRSEVNHPLISKAYHSSPRTKSAFVNRDGYAIDTYMRTLKEDADKLTKAASEYKIVGSALRDRENQLEKVKKLGKVFL